MGKWFFDFQYSPEDFQRWDRFTKGFRISAFKLKQKPPEAVVLRHGVDYDGMILEVKWFWPVSIVSWR